MIQYFLKHNWTKENMKGYTWITKDGTNVIYGRFTNNDLYNTGGVWISTRKCDIIICQFNAKANWTRPAIYCKGDKFSIE